MNKSEKWAFRILEFTVIELTVYALWLNRRLTDLEDRYNRNYRKTLTPFRQHRRNVLVDDRRRLGRRKTHRQNEARNAEEGKVKRPITYPHRVLLYFAQNLGKEVTFTEIAKAVNIPNPKNLTSIILYLQKQGVPIVHMDRGVYYLGVSELDLVS